MLYVVRQVLIWDVYHVVRTTPTKYLLEFATIACLESQPLKARRFLHAQHSNVFAITMCLSAAASEHEVRNNIVGPKTA